MPDEKTVHTTMQGTDRRAAVDAMEELLKRLRELPDWGDRKDGLIFELPDGTVAEVTRQIGEFEAITIEVRPALPSA
jgi:hypothetical protein